MHVVRPLVISLSLFASSATAAEIELAELELTHVRQGWGAAQKNRSCEGKPLRLAGATYERGLGSHAPGVIRVELDGKAERFIALVGVDDETEGKGSVRFKINGDGKLLFDSELMKGGQAPREVDLPLAGVKQLLLLMESGPDGRNYDHADWVNARFAFSGAAPRIVPRPEEKKVILTPVPPKEPRINGPKIYGVRPGSPFLYRIPCTGVRPIQFAAVGLPPGLELDEDSGIIRGSIEDRSARTYLTDLVAVNTAGRAQREFRIVVGDTLALTPPMGWNSWYIHYNRVTQSHMETAAEVMVSSGMADAGYQYVNIDDCWMKQQGDEPYRDENGDLLCNAKFPDIKGMVDAIHAKGLKAGTYISPGPWTCAGYVGSYQHEAQDAAWFARQGFDFLKYDWCSYGKVATGEGRERLIQPYRVMFEELKQQPRDIVLNLCQYGMGEVWRWGAEVGHCSRTTGDLGLERGGTLPGFYNIGLFNAKLTLHAKPGYWNDPDYILIGWVGAAHGMGEGLPTDLTGNEQYSYMSMWSLMAAPLIFSGDMAKLDRFTLNVLCNPEVIDVNQDPLGRQAMILRQTEEELVLVKPLEDGTLAVGLFNLGEAEQAIEISWKELGLQGPCRIRDLWRQQDVGLRERMLDVSAGADGMKIAVARHGVSLLKISPN